MISYLNILITFLSLITNLRGLGKTIQTISFIATLKEKLHLPGPHLVITPLSVLQNWANELARFCPTLTYKKIYGAAKEREQILNKEEVYSGSFDIYLTTYETIICEEAFFSDSWTWVTVTIDEGHRIKNENAVLRAALNRIRCPFRLLLTGTPLQNDLHELWALLNYLMPDVFANSAVFDDAVHIAGDTLNVSTVKQARRLLEEQMMLRRIKRDVETSLLPKLQCKMYVPMSSLQVKWYKQVIGKDYSTLSLLSKQQLTHILSQLRKVVNHPKQIYLKRLEVRKREAKRVQSHYYAGCEFASFKSEVS
jgi:SWI/SNF-related matrix-associated actin-dependent regulator of chromatin subfamily A member 5